MLFKHLEPKLKEYQDLPDDLTARLNFEPPPILPMICRSCGYHYGNLPMDWGEVKLQLGRGRREDEYRILSLCPKCYEGTYGADEDEEEES